MLLLQCIGEAIVAKGMRGLMGFVPFGELVYDLAEETLARYRNACQDQNLAASVEVVIQAPPAEIKSACEVVTSALHGVAAPEILTQIKTYLRHIPPLARQLFRRPDDLTGKTVPGSANLNDPSQLMAMLPQRLPLFAPEMTVPDAPQWQLVELLGIGGFGEVWLARHKFLGQLRAIKFCLDATVRDRLLRHEGEIVLRVMQASAAVKSEEHGFVPLLDAHLEGDTPWLAYEYIDGGDLAGLVREASTRPAPERATEMLKLLLPLAAVVGRFHRLATPIIHRDLKPSNILVKPGPTGWQLRITDFGISHVAAVDNLNRGTALSYRPHLGQTYRGAHTPLYASPQQKRGQPADPRDDVFALGVIGYQMLLGDLGAERPAGKWRKRLGDCGLCEAVFDVLERCWTDDQEERPGDAAELAFILEQALLPTAGFPSTNSFADVDADWLSYLEFRKESKSTKPWLVQRALRVDRWKECAEAGHSGAMVLLGDSLAEGAPGRTDINEAMMWFRKAVDLGNSVAMGCMGWLYRAGLGVTKDMEEAMRWYRRAADQGDTWSMTCVAHLYQKRQEYTEAVRWYGIASEKGQTSATFHLGTCYDDGLGVPQDTSRAMHCYRQAAAAGHAIAMNNLGMMCDSGRGTQQDHREAMGWFLQAAEHGLAAAMTNIGMLYYNGEGTTQDDFQAAHWFRKGAEAGDPDSMYMLGRLHEKGKGVHKDLAEATLWYRKAASLGHEAAAARLGK